MKAKMKPRYMDLLDDFHLPHKTELELEEQRQLPTFYRITKPMIMHGISVSVDSVDLVGEEAQ